MSENTGHYIFNGNEPLLRTLKNAGGTYDINGDYSGIYDPDVNDFCVTPDEEDDIMHLERLSLSIQHTQNSSPSEYASGTALANGIYILLIDKNIVDGGTPSGFREFSLINGIPIKQNIDWELLCFDAEKTSYSAVTDYSFKAKWSILKDGYTIVLRWQQYFCVRVNDNMSTRLNRQIFQVSGSYGLRRNNGFY